jgi:hypothetical protein
MYNSKTYDMQEIDLKFNRFKSLDFLLRHKMFCNVNRL